SLTVCLPPRDLPVDRRRADVEHRRGPGHVAVRSFQGGFDRLTLDHGEGPDNRADLPTRLAHLELRRHMRAGCAPGIMDRLAGTAMQAPPGLRCRQRLRKHPALDDLAIVEH